MTFLDCSQDGSEMTSPSPLIESMSFLPHALFIGVVSVASRVIRQVAFDIWVAQAVYDANCSLVDGSPASSRR